MSWGSWCHEEILQETVRCGKWVEGRRDVVEGEKGWLTLVTVTDTPETRETHTLLVAFCRWIITDDRYDNDNQWSHAEMMLIDPHVVFGGWVSYGYVDHIRDVFPLLFPVSFLYQCIRSADDELQEGGCKNVDKRSDEQIFVGMYHVFVHVLSAERKRESIIIMGWLESSADNSYPAVIMRGDHLKPGDEFFLFLKSNTWRQMIFQ